MRDVTEQDGSNRVMNGNRGSPITKLKSAEAAYVTKPAGVTNGSEISDDDVNDEFYEEDGEFSAKYYQLEKEIQELLSERFGEETGNNGK
jgi:protein-tyrosine-phosphatase